MAIVFKLNFKIINLPNKLIFAAWRGSEFINSFSIGVKSNNFPN